jgi:hypothetical protein
VPELFSPFAVSLVRQGEARNDIAGAFYRIADFLQKEDEVAVTHRRDYVGASDRGRSTPSSVDADRYAVVTPSTILPVWVIDDLISRAQVAALRIFTVAAGLLLTLAAVWASVEAGFVERRWQNVVLCSVAALFIGGAGIWLRRRIEEDSRHEQQRREALEAKAAQALDEARPRKEGAEVLGPPAPALTANGAAPTASPPATATPRAPREATFE